VKRLSDQTLYEILEVPPDAAPPAIEAAYERARSLYAPGSLATYTLMTTEEASLLTSRIEEARRTLLDADARSHYDAGLVAPKGGHAPANGEAGPVPAPLAALPPVIPAAPPVAEEPAPPPAPAPVAAPEPPAARPAELLRVAAEAVPPAPIRLEREVPAPAPAAEPPPASPPPPEPAAAPAAEIPLPEGALWTGEALRRVREARGLTVQQIAERTKVTRHHVENIEAERFSSLPAPVYLRGILLAVARELRLDGQKVARAYLERAAAAAGQGARR
jgi:hypothetical protein